MTKKYFKGHLLIFVKIRIAKKCILYVKSWYILRWGRTKPTVCNNKICGPGPSKKMGGSRPIFQCNSAGTLPFFKFKLHFSFSTKSHLIWYVAVLPHSLIFFYSIENAKIQHISSKWLVLKEIDNFSLWYLISFSYYSGGLSLDYKLCTNFHSLFLFSAHCFSHTLGIPTKLIYFRPSYFDSTRRNM